MPLSTTLKFSPYAWAKLLFWANAFDHEISGMGISHPADPMTVIDLVIIKQKSSLALTTFDPAAYADFVMEYCDPDGKYKYKPSQCQRLWLHTHPPGVAGPSGTDESTFKDSFGNCDWSVMAIMPKGGELFARLHMKVGDETVDVPMKSSVSWHLPFQAADHAVWGAEVLKYVEVATPYVPRVQFGATASASRVIPVPPAPVVQKGPTNIPKAPQTSNIIPFDKNSTRVPANQKTAERKHLSKRERRVARRKEAKEVLDELTQQSLLETAGSGSIKHLYSNTERLRVPRMTPENIQLLENSGMQVVYMGNASVHFMAQLPDGAWHNITYEDAWLLKEDTDTLLEELGGLEHAIVNQTDVKTRKLNDKVNFSTYATAWEEVAEHKYTLQAIEVPGFTEVFLTDTELEAVNSVASGKLSCDEALTALPDYETPTKPVEAKDVPTEKISKPPEIGSAEDSKLTEKAMDLLAGGPEVLILESDN